MFEQNKFIFIDFLQNELLMLIETSCSFEFS